MSTRVWTSDRFRDELRAFVAGAVGEPTSFACERLRPWSTVWRATTSSGVYFAKDNCAGQRHEAALMARLAELAPEHVIPVTATDPDRGWLLTPDQGPTLSEAGSNGGDPFDVDLWCRIAAAAADLQRTVVPHAHTLGLTVLDPADAVALTRHYLGVLPTLDDTARAGIEAVLPDVARWSEQVAALGLPLTLLHNDLHDANVFVIGNLSGGGIRFFDFGDAVLADPLSALRVPINNLQDALACAPDDPRLWRVADAALEVWSDLTPMRELRAALPAAMQLARLARVESWRRCLLSMEPDSELLEYADAPARWLRSLTDPPGLRAT